MTLRRRFILMLSSVIGAYVLLAPASTPSLGSIECAAPPYFDALTSVELSSDHDSMSALRQRAGTALAELQTRTAATP